MQGIIIRSRSSKGNDSLLQNQRDTRKARFSERAQLKLVVNITFDDSKDFFVLTLMARSKYILSSALANIAHEMMSENGSVENKDYVIEEVEK